ncbi:MAG TPA: hypothetical protein VJT70_05970 [Sphingomicrobium sp.]|nr:hypothetical protein [Sphingomicrobium sp.]
MNWHRASSYHNSRNYDDEAPRAGPVSGTRIALAWLVAAGVGRLKKLLELGFSRSEEEILLTPRTPHGFTILGAAIERHAPHETALSCPFPELDDHTARQRANARSSRAQPANDPTELSRS